MSAYIEEPNSSPATHLFLLTLSTGTRGLNTIATLDNVGLEAYRAWTTMKLEEDYRRLDAR